MPDEPNTDPTGPALSQLAEAVAAAQLKPENLEKLRKHEQTLALEKQKDLDEYSAKTFDWILELLGRVLIKATDLPEGLLDPIARGAIESLLGGGEGGRHGADNAGARLIGKLSGTEASVEPGIAGAARYLTIFINESMEALLRGVAIEVVTEFAPKIAGIGGGIETLQHLQEVIENALGGSRMVRRVLQPFISATAITPAQWHVNKRYRPELLALGAAIEAHLRGAFPRDQLEEELARQGWSAERIQLQIDNARKRLALDDLLFQHFRGSISDVEVVDQARALGYDDTTTRARLAIEDRKRVEALNAPIIAEAIAAYLAGNIEAPAMERWVRGAAPSVLDAERIVATATARNELRVRRISSTRIRAMVLDGVANVVDFRHALEREGYPPEDVTLEELSLRFDIKQKHDLQHKDPTIAQLEAAVLAGALSLDDFTRAAPLQQLTDEGRAVTIRVLQAKIDKQAADAAEKEQREQEKAERQAELESRRARTFPALQEYRRAYVRGFIDRGTYAAALAREKIVDDDATFLLAGADDEREQYLADQEKRAQTEADQANRGLSVAQLEQAVLEGVLSVEEFDADLARNHVPDDNRRLLVKLVQAKLEDRAAADAKRREAERRAALRQVSLADWEHAVRLGVRSIEQYGAYLESLELDAPSRALILDALAAQLAVDQAAKARRDAADAAAAAKGLPLAQRRRAVIAGVVPKDFYADAIRLAGWPVDDQLADLALLDAEIAAAAAARVRRDQVVERVAPSIVTVSQLEHALVLGLLTPQEFHDELLDRGAPAADADLLLQLAIAKVPDARAGAQLHDRVARELAAKGVSLADLEAAVRRGIVTLDDYALDLSNRGYDRDAVALLRQLLEERLGVDVDALRSKLEAALTKAGADFTLTELEAALDAGEIDAATFQGALAQAGASRDAALVFTRIRTW